MRRIRLFGVVLSQIAILAVQICSPAFAAPLKSHSTRESGEVPFLDSGIWKERDRLSKGVIDNIEVLKTGAQQSAYKQLSVLGITQNRMLRSLQRFHQILTEAPDFASFQLALQHEFVLVRSPGRDGLGTVRFTGYYQPTLQASRVKTSVYKYPIYRLPEDFDKWTSPHPTRVALEGFDGTGVADSVLKGHELAWLANRFDAFSAHLQGSAVLEFGAGDKIAACFAGGTAHPFRGFSATYLAKHKIPWSKLGDYFTQHPNELNTLLSKNNRFIFFKQCPEPFPIGSLGVPVIAERSMATDKTQLPPAGLGIVRTQIPEIGADGKLRNLVSTKLVLDQDSGSAIKGPGRVDLYMGTGAMARMKASSIYGNGELYYLVQKEG